MSYDTTAQDRDLRLAREAGRNYDRATGRGDLAAARIHAEDLHRRADLIERCRRATRPADPPGESCEDPTRGDKKRQILAHLDQQGEATTGQIAGALQLSLSTVSSTLTRAAKAGEVLDCGHGRWSSITAHA